MKRFVLFAAALAGMAALAMAVAPWTVSSSALAGSIAKQLRDALGLELRVGGRSTFAALPVPRLKFENIALTGPDGTTVAAGGQLRGELKILPLLTGRLELAELSLSGSRLKLDLDSAAGGIWTRTLARLRQRAAAAEAGATHLRRLVLIGCELAYRDARREVAESLDSINLVVSWPRPAAPLEIAGSLRWHGETVQLQVTELRPEALWRGQASRVSIKANAAQSRLSLAAEAKLTDGFHLAGRSSFESGAFGPFLRWSRLDVPLGAAVQAFSLDGDFDADARRVSWPSIRLGLGPDRLDGAVAAQIDGERLGITGTLAADTLALTPFVAPLWPARLSGSGWSSEPIETAAPSAADLDLRVSASTARLGAVRLDDLAANLMVKAGRVELSLGRATLSKGVVKGRAVVSATAKGLDLRAQGSLDRVEVGALLGDLGQPRWLNGSIQAQLAVEAVGETAAQLARTLQGRASVTVRQGELVGIGLPEVLRRAERRPLSTSLDWRGGRTAFDQAQLALAIGEGAAEITEGAILGAGLRGNVTGRLSLVDRMLAARVSAEAPPAGNATAPAPAVAFDITGPWEDVAITPDVQALIQRSGAAQPLLSGEPRAKAVP